ncbi:MAG: DNA repair protein RecN [Bacteroidales bacterium]|nr:DNA repair protein RecN [Bacteroidales bacterium]
MLESLSIRNYALINELDIIFKPGFSIITGETGAGKSILLGAVSLIAGQRADTSVLLDKNSKCTVEGVFNIANYDLKSFFSDNDIDFDEYTIIRREISNTGKSRAFINDTPVNLQQLKELGDYLIDIHSQHETTKLNLPAYQLNALDVFAGTQDILTEYKRLYYDYTSELAEFERRKADAEKLKSDLDYFQYQFDQLENAKLIIGEENELEEEQEVLGHTEEIKENLSAIDYMLLQEEQSVISRLKESTDRMGRIAGYYSKVKDVFERIQSVYIEIKDLANEIENLNEEVHFDPQRFQFVNERLDLIFSLLQKHNVKSIEELISFKNQLQKKIDIIMNYDTNLEQLSRALELKKKGLLGYAVKLTEKRMSVISKVEESISTMLIQMGIPNARFKVEREAYNDFTSTGMDKVTFLFSANKQSALEPVSKVASGGELSRLMLSIKSIIAHSIALPTIIFDEIDTGVSGEVADKVGVIMKNMSENLQVINITHSPQIASRGKYHYLVFKEDVENKTITNIKQLNEDERIIEIAKMLSGEEITEAAMSNAKELLKN